MIDLCFFPKRLLDCRDQILELNGLALAEIEDVERRPVVVQRSHRALNYIVYVSVVASRRAVAELIDRLAGVNASGELMDRQIGPLPWTVNGEITQRHHAHLIKMREGGTKKLRRNFCRGVGTKRLSEMLIFRKRNGFRNAVNG